MTTEVFVTENALCEMNVLPFTALVVSIRATLPTIAERAMPADKQLRTEAARLGLDINVPTQWVYTDINGDATHEFQLEIALPVPPGTVITPDEPFTIKVFPIFHCVQYTYKGRWDDFSGVYDALFRQLYASGLSFNNQVREVYRVVDMEWPNQCVTDIQIGLS